MKTLKSQQKNQKHNKTHRCDIYMYLMYLMWSHVISLIEMIFDKKTPVIVFIQNKCLNVIHCKHEVI